MIRNALFTMLALAAVAVLHVFVNESVEGARWLLLVGAAAGMLLALLSLGGVYATQGQLAVVVNGERWSGWSFWYRVSLLSFVIGTMAAFSVNAVRELPPQRIESWAVTYNGPRTMRQINPLASRLHRGLDERVLELSNGDRHLRYTYLPGVSRRLSDVVCGSEVQVRQRMGGLGFFRVEGVFVE
ncbi:hypothetical protein [Sinimarinibacterium flocculans]|uniref:hypothetical protein n=1 Tax=Sinimarinibacterium flocculans TaxID=985250 RepID=UPI0035123282